ncbi:crotonase/enoyl-CoA hydratase family protein [Lentibacter algarum]|uniref:crotonase/enoyl-CoA hydratase family protein n=1 Tax=Lentibacter algarum TaxID=576131 RepID=UPI001C06BEA0|nr:crotonase/enoyl-CoA hydratase family protein [Lentibacter algarum]MBU2981962.1 crotonase/enoyl-CoA hydratase family protein [Lentibacter algarum]
MTRVTTEIKDHIAFVTLTRADKMNGVDQAMGEGLINAAHALQDNDDIRAVVLSGDGRAFCAGLDVSSFATLAGGNPEEIVMPRTHGNANFYQEIVLAWRRLPVPVIAALHGVSYGAGFQLCSAADMRIAHPETKLSIMEMKWGLVPDMGGMALWPAYLRSDVIRQMTYTAEPVDAVQGLAWGLVTELSETPLERATELATLIASKSPSAVRAAKRLIETVESGVDEDAVLMAESREQTDLIGKPHQMEVVMANMQKRAPNFG